VLLREESYKELDKSTQSLCIAICISDFALPCPGSSTSALPSICAIHYIIASIALGLYEENECSRIRFPRSDKKYKVAGVPI